ncbi:hypothetical protein A3A21_01685 [Candidatus Jorgensenbacteria bacterium RIFCSPLOWO2_01_FULL_45_25b]|uniref:FAD/NAD(P)-binding domain-containing protein n=1 Tax=Candidatus Jorgensenbacteria bacterium RIFCSPLOWO2_01_FULL_45_25b TaxID=1798471 RepID=A0A1F6BT48_9BACT|nr:MAG: hypothetical protein A3A21_01685 [Candidatus Jorgensenbacteria bacterium RIFCSPLOWO2_01_FULL_45_25b]
MSTKTILIVGGGFGGIRTALCLLQKLARYHLLSRYEIVLADKNASHTYTPLLYEAACVPSGASSREEIQSLVSYLFSSVFFGRRITFLEKEVLRVDVAGKKIIFSTGSRAFDYLVLATGLEVNYFGIPGASEYALPLKTHKDALAIRDSVIRLSEQSERISLVVGGGGPTGVELASELKNWIPEADVVLLEGKERILSGFDERIQSLVLKRLSRLGVQVKTCFCVSSVEKDVVLSTNGARVSSSLFLWTAGVGAGGFTERFPFLKTKGGCLAVDPFLRCFSLDSEQNVLDVVYALGDVSLFSDYHAKQTLPLLAQIALDEARVVSSNIVEDIRLKEGFIHRASFSSFFPKKEYPYVLPVGGKFAVAKVGGIIFSGFFGWLMKGLVELRYLLSIFRARTAFQIWFKGLLIFLKDDKLG